MDDSRRWSPCGDWTRIVRGQGAAGDGRQVRFGAPMHRAWYRCREITEAGPLRTRPRRAAWIAGYFNLKFAKSDEPSCVVIVTTQQEFCLFGVCQFWMN